ncbi:CD3324 family protein [Bittarella massiliensis (ex Durand et al. 2017)]|uniref:CD3324 family protein n=1 Tax=Bittarella massiliensis (ex Durand et al. 2017) TaxID=1720313 RepID=UPI0009EB56EE|nr:CD3324 family protein [Bittarella massiliensis (ex Durand et al. 2017)]
MPYLEFEKMPIEESKMGYQSATERLPADLVREIQKYVDGEYLYIPSRKRKSWGSKSGAREFFAKRDLEICREYQKGVPIEALSDKYSLSLKGIERILTSQRKRGV